MWLINIHESVSTRLWKSTWVCTMVVWLPVQQALRQVIITRRKCLIVTSLCIKLFWFHRGKIKHYIMATGIFYYHGVFATIITSITIIGNLLTIVAFFRVRMLRLNPSNQLILALSIADLLYAVFVLVFAAIPYAFLSYYPYGEIGCSILVAGSNFYVVGNLILVAISVDRLLLVSLALLYLYQNPDQNAH